MKKLIILIVVMLIITGCTSNEYDSNLTPPDISGEQPTVSLVHDEVMSGDFSSIMGEYENSNGNRFILDSTGFLGENETISGITFNELNNQYFMQVQSDGYGIQMNIYDIGSEVITYNGGNEVIETDTTKIRIHLGHDYPLSAEEIYVKK